MNGCATTTKDGVSGVKRSQFMLIPASQVVSMSGQDYTQRLQDSTKKNTLNTEKVQLERVCGISNRLIAQVGYLGQMPCNENGKST